MASTSGSYDGHSVVSAEVRRALARRLRSLLGLAVMVAAARRLWAVLRERWLL